ncbi:hypothetical protein [Micromonospora sp. NPDC049274]|uniref:hypothetical protein n=1 Tax=Micromonospora sp. NPDC049274 TaxID=3154829 RepID=UPI0034488B9C
MTTSPPLWVTIVGLAAPGIFGIAGAVVGQWVSGRRDDKRWEREQDREHQRRDEELHRRRTEDQRRAAETFLAAVWRAYGAGASYLAFVRGEGLKTLGHDPKQVVDSILATNEEVGVALSAVHLHFGRAVSEVGEKIETYLSSGLAAAAKSPDHFDLEGLQRLVRGFTDAVRSEVYAPPTDASRG